MRCLKLLSFFALARSKIPEGTELQHRNTLESMYTQSPKNGKTKDKKKKKSLVYTVHIYKYLDS